MANQKLTAEQLHEALLLKELGLSVVKVAAKLGTDYQFTYRMLIRYKGRTLAQLKKELK